VPPAPAAPSVSSTESLFGSSTSGGPGNDNP
jgi:hypothetical protein